MDSFVGTLFFFILALGILIAVHEFGHFWVARKLGVKVLRFSIGFGKTLWKRTGKVDGTEYVIAAVPLGGYVKMLDEREGEVGAAELHRAFNRQSLKVRTAVVLAGPLFNFFFAIAAFWLIFVSGDTGTRPWVGEVAESTPAYEAGFMKGDEVLSVGDRKTPTWESVAFALMTDAREGQPLSVKVRDPDGYEMSRVLSGSQLTALADSGGVLPGIGLTPLRPSLPPVIGTIVPGEAADQAGLQSGDLVTRVEGEPLEMWSDLVTLIRKNPGNRLNFEVERDGQILEFPVTISGLEENGVTYGRVGAGVSIPEGWYDEYQVVVRLGPLEAVGEAVAKTGEMSLFMLKMLGRMLVGEASVKNLSGPISIAQTAGKTASYGVVYFVKFLALVSISLGVLNLLPVPILDGGHLLFFLVEAIKGGPVSEEAQMQGQKIGLVLILALMGLAFYVDISRLLG
ncbi:MAG: RIP metalloprotease RseP [Gammaproteobacteria bacterium]|nr:RIP metalloprotease RseP [Gammaproteobacteria bacterium]